MNTIPLYPKQASNFAQEMDLLYFLLVALTLLFSALVFGPVIYFVAKYRVGSKANRKRPAYHNLRLELAWSLIPLALCVPVFIWASKLYVEMYTPMNAPNALQIFIVGKQWMWHLQHPTGQRENNELHIPVGRPINMTMISQDVLHSFFVPDFRIKRDVLPNRYVSQWVIATEPGRYRLFCAEFCGAKHSEMTGWVYAMEPAEYERWLKQVRWGIGSGRAAETMEQAGARLYRELGCNACHDPGKARRAPQLSTVFGRERKLSDGRTVIADEAYIRRSIYEPDSMKSAGYEPIMPSYKGSVDEQQVLQLIAYIKSLKGKDTKDKP